MNAEPRRRMFVVETLAVFACFLTYSLVQAPIPGINEPHYLTKAKHFWNSDFAPGDFFLESSSPHFFFYLTLGPLTQFLSFELTAYVARCLALLVLAAGWTSLIGRIIPRGGSSVLLAGLFLGYTSWQIELFGWNGFSGEWIVGGVESKVFAWGFLFWSLAELIEQRTKRSALCLGLAISFHPIIGVWGALSMAIASWFGRTSDSAQPRNQTAVPLMILVVTALPGLVPAAMTVLDRHPENTVANRIQVIERLGHHLDPLRFPLQVYLLYAGLVIAWLIGSAMRMQRSSDAHSLRADRLWFWFVVGSFVIACCGIVVGLLRLAPLSESFANLVITLMKFYPFRLADILIPLATLIAIVDLVTFRFADRKWLAPVMVVVGTAGLAAGLQPQLVSRNPERFADGQEAAWIDVCRWIKTNTPNEAVIIAPRAELTLKWYASRASYFSHKDMPQDTAGILEWQRRRELLNDWYARNYTDEFYSKAELAELRQLTGASYLIARRLGPLEIEPIYRNKWYRVYEFP